MSTKIDNSTEIIRDALESLSVSGMATAAYLYLVEHGPQSARMLAEGLVVPRTSIYNALNDLMAADIVVESEVDNRKVFAVGDPQQLLGRVQDQKQRLARLSTRLEAVLPELSQVVETIEPKIRFFSGREGVRKIVRDILWYEDMEILSFFAIEEMIQVFGEEDFKRLHKSREKNRLSLRVIWPHDKMVDFKKYPWLQSSAEQLREIRIAPGQVTWDMSFWLYGDKVLFVSSRRELFGFIVQSRDFAAMLRVLFEGMWQSSRVL